MKTKSAYLSNTAFAHQVGFLTGMTAVKDAANTEGKPTTLKEAAELIAWAIKFNQKAFVAGIAEALLVPLLAADDTDANNVFLKKLHNDETDVQG